MRWIASVFMALIRAYSSATAGPEGWEEGGGAGGGVAGGAGGGGGGGATVFLPQPVRVNAARRATMATVCLIPTPLLFTERRRALRWGGARRWPKNGSRGAGRP